MNGAAASRCSKLSATSSRCLAARKRSTACSGDSPASRMIPSALTIAAGTSSGRCTAASDTKRAPSAKSASTARAASSASRVLPTPPGPVSVKQPDRCGAQSLADRCELVLATDRAIRRRRQRAVASAPDARRARAVGRPRRGGGIERGVVGEDRLVEVMQLGSWLDPELLDEDLARVAVGLQRVGLAAAAVQREHQLRVQPLAPRVLGRELLELGDQLRVAPGGEVGVDAHLQRREALLLQAARSRPARTARRRARRAAVPATAPAPRAAPRRHRRHVRPPAPGGRRRRWRLEALGVELAGAHAQPVAGRGGDQHVRVAERLAQARDVDLDGLDRAGRRVLAP